MDARRAQMREFFAILTHDDRKSNYIVARADGGRWSERACKAAELADVDCGGAGSLYVTRNGFNGRKREANRCRQVNAIMFDVDCHGDGGARALPALVDRVYEAVFAAELPHPNLLVNTGRGLQVYYVLGHSTPVRVKGGKVNERGLGFFRDVESGLARRLEGIVGAVEGAELDGSVYDFSRVSRVPGSFNPKAGKVCELLLSSDDYYTLTDLKRYCAPKPRKAPARARARAAARGRDGSRMLEARMRMVEALQERRGYDCEGSRENMCFVYYNSACQVHDRDKALEMTHALNAAFARPLPRSDIECIKRTVDNVVVEYGPHKGETGFYPLKAATVVEKLFMTAEEVAALGVFSPSRRAQREESKRRTRERRAERDRRICELYQKGYKQAQVARKVKCSLRTVSTVVNREGAKRGSLKETVRAEYESALEAKAARAAERAANGRTPLGRAANAAETAAATGAGGQNSPLTCENASEASERAKRWQTSWVVESSFESDPDRADDPGGGAVDPGDGSPKADPGGK